MSRWLYAMILFPGTLPKITYNVLYIPEPDSHPKNGSSSKPKNPKNKILTTTTSPKPRPSTAPASRPSTRAQSTPVDEPHKAPFVPYGFKYKAKETGVKKTHNVRASADVSIHEILLAFSIAKQM